MRTPACLLALLLLCTPALAAPIEGRATVIDGDTIAVEGTAERIRLYGIDAPESGQTCDDASGKRYLCGSKAAEHLADLIGRNGRVSCVEEDRDRYGRIVADCRIGDQSLNGGMVSAGWAIEYSAYSDGRFTEAQKLGEAAKAGMWSGSFIDPALWRKGEREIKPVAKVKDLREFLVAQGRQSCKAAKTCRDAVEMWCGGYAGADRDDDGIPCESVCKSKAQVDKIKADIGC